MGPGEPRALKSRFFMSHSTGQPARGQFRAPGVRVSVRCAAQRAGGPAGGTGGYDEAPPRIHRLAGALHTAPSTVLHGSPASPYADGGLSATRAPQAVRVVQETRPPSFSGLGRRPFTAVARVRIPLGVLGRIRLTDSPGSEIRFSRFERRRPGETHARPCSAVG